MISRATEEGMAGALHRVSAWARAQGDSARTLPRFRSVFAFIWFIYDAIDLSTFQTLNGFSYIGLAVHPLLILLPQAALLFFEAGMIFAVAPSLCAGGALLSRALFSYHYPLNDFLYFCIVSLVLTQVDDKRNWAWPRDVLLVQTAWIYLASAVLKMNPPYLSGGDLYVRLNYTASVLPIPYPESYRAAIGKIGVCSGLAWVSVAVELLLPLCLLAWWRCPEWRHWLRLTTLALSMSVHLFAAYALNVFFFGASMMAQIFFLTRERRR